MEDWHWNYVLHTCNFVTVITAEGKVTKFGSMAIYKALNAYFLLLCFSVLCI